MKFEIGDKVKIVSLDTTKNHFGLNDSMKKLLGKIVTIQDIGKSPCFSGIYKYIINEWSFHEDDLKPITTELEVE
jgi:hypothetical protein